MACAAALTLDRRAALAMTAFRVMADVRNLTDCENSPWRIRPQLMGSHHVRRTITLPIE